MTLISCALRDALISTGHIELALDIQQKLIQKIENSTYEYLPPQNKFELLDIPEGDSLSFKSG